MEYHKINIFQSGKTQAGIGLHGRSCAHVAHLASLQLAISPPLPAEQTVTHWMPCDFAEAVIESIQANPLRSSAKQEGER